MSTNTMKHIIAVALIALAITIDYTTGGLGRWNPAQWLNMTTALILIGAAVYLLPAIIANQRHAQNLGYIFALNLFMGFTVIGWVAAFIWAAVDRPRAM